MGTCRHHGALARTDRPLRIAPGHLHPDRAPPPGYRTAARRACRPGGDAKRRDLHGASLRPSPSAIADAARWAARPRSSRWCGRRTAGFAPRMAREFPIPKSLRRHFRRTSFPARLSARTSTVPSLPLDFQWLRSPWPEELFSLTERPGYLRLYGRETLGSLFRQSLVARRQQSHCLQRRDGDGVRAGPVPADGRPDLLLQQQQVSLPLRLARRDDRQAHPGHVVSARPGPVGCLQRAGRAFPRERRCTCGWKSISSGFILPIVSKAANGPGCPALSMRASCPTRRRLPERPISPAPLSGFVARTLAGTRQPADFDYFMYRERSYCAEPFAADCV